MRKTPAFVLLTAACCLFTRPSIAQDDSAAVETERTIGLRQEYLKNRDKFRRFTCRFRLMQGTCESLAEALAGKIEVVSPMTGLWCVDGEKQRFELITERVGESPIPEIVAEPGPNIGFVGVRFRDTEKYLVDGATGIHFSPIFGASIGEQIKNVRYPYHLPLPWPEFTDTPIGMGLMAQYERWSPGADLVNFGAPKNLRRMSESAMSTDGRPCEVLTVARGSLHLKWFLDPKCGYLPIEGQWVEATTGEIVLQAIVTDARETSNGGHFPFRSVVIGQPAAMRRHSVSIYEVSEVSLERPTSADLSLVLPAGSDIRELRGSNSITLAEETTIAADSLSAWREHVENPEANPHPKSDKSSPPSKDR